MCICSLSLSLSQTASLEAITSDAYPLVVAYCPLQSDETKGSETPYHPPPIDCDPRWWPPHCRQGNYIQAGEETVTIIFSLSRRFNLPLNIADFIIHCDLREKHIIRISFPLRPRLLVWLMPKCSSNGLIPETRPLFV